MFFGSVPRGAPPDRTCDKADEGTKPEGCTPSLVSDEPCEQRRRKAASGSNPGEDEAIDEAALFGWNPARNELIGSGIDDGLAGTEGKAYSNQQQNGVSDSRGKQGGEGGCDSPPEDANRQNLARTEASRQASRRQL